MAEIAVAPFVGAWIETKLMRSEISIGLSSLPSWERGLKHLCDNRLRFSNLVAPFVGAWIETVAEIGKGFMTKVAPFVGAWIET